MENRLGWDEYFIKMAFLVAERSTCLRRHVGAIIVKENRVVSTGYNGAGSGIEDCRIIGCIRDELKIESGKNQEICRAIHAEQNAIIHAALQGGNISGSTLYCTHSPCIICAKMIVNAKIKRAVCCHTYSEQAFINILKEAQIKFEVIAEPNLNISKKV